jgi:hypothetical protein
MPESPIEIFEPFFVDLFVMKAVVNQRSHKKPGLVDDELSRVSHFLLPGPLVVRFLS